VGQRASYGGVDVKPVERLYVCRHPDCALRAARYTKATFTVHYELVHGEDLVLNDMRVSEWGVEL
jgi:hypothetical protein